MMELNSSTKNVESFSRWKLDKAVRHNPLCRFDQHKAEQSITTHDAYWRTLSLENFSHAHLSKNQ